MFEEIAYYISLFAIPVILIALFVVSLFRYLSGKRKNKLAPGTISSKKMKIRKICLIVSSIIAGIFFIVVIGYLVLLGMAITSVY